jgi:hypothetical protein
MSLRGVLFRQAHQAPTREDIMSDDKSKTGAADRRQVAGGETYEVDDFAHKHGLSRAAARALIKTHGNDRATLDKAAELQKRQPAH